MMRMTQLQVEEHHGLRSNTQPRALGGAGMAIRDPSPSTDVSAVQINACIKKGNISMCTHLINM